MRDLISDVRSIGIIDRRMLGRLVDLGFFPSTCTIQDRDYSQQQPSGQVKHGDNYTDVAGLVDLKCRKAPIILVRPTGLESRSHITTKSSSTFQLLFPANYPAITTRMRAVVDGETYNIQGVDTDGQGLMTRLKIEKSVPYGD